MSLENSNGTKLDRETDTGALLKTHSESRKSKDSKQSDSGFESEQMNKLWSSSSPPGSFTPKTIVSMMAEGPDKPEPAFKKTLFIPKPIDEKTRRRRMRGRRLRNIRDKSAQIWSKGKKLAMTLKGSMDNHNQLDECYSASGSGGETDNELEDIPEKEPNLGGIANDAISVDLDGSYIDPTTIVSVPSLSTRMQEMQAHDPVFGAKPKVKTSQGILQAPKQFTMASENHDRSEGRQNTLKVIDIHSYSSHSVDSSPMPERHDKRSRALGNANSSALIRTNGTPAGKHHVITAEIEHHSEKSDVESNVMKTAKEAASNKTPTLSDPGYISLLTTVTTDERFCQICQMEHLPIYSDHEQPKVKYYNRCLLAINLKFIKFVYQM